MKRIVSYNKLFLAMLVFGLISACGTKSMTPEEAIEKNETAMKAMDSVELTINSAGTPHWIQINAQEKTAYHTFESGDLEFTYDEDVLMAKVPSGLVAQGSKENHEKVIHDLEFMLKPFDFLKVLDEGIVDKFIVTTENDEEITIAYDSEEYENAASELSGRIILLLEYSLEQLITEQIPENIDFEFEPLELEFTIDKSDYLLREFNLQVTPIDDLIADSIAYDLVMTYDDYNKDFDIVMFEETEDLLIEEKQEPIVYSDITEEEAAAYLEAVIQATVYQNAEGYVELATQSIGEDIIENDSIIFRDTFKSILIENSKQSWEDINISDEKHESVADAFFHALAKTKYEIVGQEKIDDGVLVTLLIQGLNETEINEKSTEEMMRLIEEEGLSQAEALDKLFELVIEAYNNVEILEDAVSVDVPVHKIDENFILDQNQYLNGGFVQ